MRYICAYLHYVDWALTMEGVQLPDTTNQELFADCQLQVWAITSISELAVASYTEDMYGVVQRVSSNHK